MRLPEFRGQPKMGKTQSRGAGEGFGELRFADIVQDYRKRVTLGLVRQPAEKAWRLLAPPFRKRRWRPVRPEEPIPPARRASPGRGVLASLLQDLARHLE